MGVTGAAVVIQLGGSIFVFIVISLVIGALLWISALVSVLVHRDEPERGSQLLWTLVILIAGPVGATLYFLLARRAPEVPREAIPDRRRRVQAIAEPWSSSASDRPG
ncbi:MAG: PLDc N-terminal domain-containing protein [Actinomycetota bacterium]|nr:PLDc N-terminal domain-containing protein [Actinomycetota bacterium]